MSVIYRSDREKYQATVWVNGKRRRPLFDTKKEADDFDRKHRLGKFGLTEQRESILISEGFKAYFETESVFKSKKSKDNDQRYINFAFHFLSAVKGLEYLDEVELEHLQGFQSWIELAHKCGEESKDRWAIPTVARCCKMIKHLFHKAAMTKKLKEDPALYWSIPVGESKRRRPMTLEEFNTIYEKSESWFKPVLTFKRHTGARGSSIAGLQWQDVDLARRILVLRSRKGGRQKVRQITLPVVDEVFSLLVGLRNARPFARPTDHIFLTGVGEPIDPRWIASCASRLIKKCGLEGVVFYGLRHALATDMTEAGISLEITRQALGHSSVRTTQIYAQGIGIASIAKAIDAVRKSGSVPPTATSVEGGTALGGN